MSYASDALGDLGQRWLHEPTTLGLDIPKDPYLRERGAANLNLIPEGVQEIHRVGAGFAQALGASSRAGQRRQIKIYTSPWARTKQTAAILAQHLAPFKPQVVEVPELAPQSLGDLEGEKKNDVEAVKRQLNLMTPQNQPPGQSKFTGAFGESRNSYESRLLPAVQRIVEESERNPNLIAIVAAHSGDMKAIQGSEGRDDNIDGIRTDRMRLDNAGRWQYERGVQPGALPGVWLQRHGSTEFNLERPELARQQQRTNTRPTLPSNPSSGGNSSGTPSPVL